MQKQQIRPDQPSEIFTFSAIDQHAAALAGLLIARATRATRASLHRPTPPTPPGVAYTKAVPAAPAGLIACIYRGAAGSGATNVCASRTGGDILRGQSETCRWPAHPMRTTQTPAGRIIDLSIVNSHDRPEQAAATLKESAAGMFWFA